MFELACIDAEGGSYTGHIDPNAVMTIEEQMGRIGMVQRKYCVITLHAGKVIKAMDDDRTLAKRIRAACTSSPRMDTNRIHTK